MTATISITFPICGDLGYGYKSTITSLTEGDGKLYAVGFTMAKFKADQDPNKPAPISPVARPALAIIEMSNPSQNCVQEITGCAGASLGLPISAIFIPGASNDGTMAANPSPANGAANVSITAMLNWTAGLDASSHDVYFGTSSPGAFCVNQTTTRYNPGALFPNTTYYWRLDEHNSSDTVTGSVWTFTTTATVGQASVPYPANTATVVDLGVKLSWSAACGATSHDVHFGTTNPPPPAGNQSGTIFDPGRLASGTTYYWRIDEVGGAEVVTGTLWSFTSRMAGDFNDDGQVNAADLEVFIACATGPAMPYNATALPTGCDPMPVSDGIIAADFDEDGDVDAVNFAAFQRAWTPGS